MYFKNTLFKILNIMIKKHQNNQNNNFNNFLLWIKKHFFFIFCNSVYGYMIINSKTLINTNNSSINKPAAAFVITSLTQEEKNVKQNNPFITWDLNTTLNGPIINRTGLELNSIEFNQIVKSKQVNLNGYYLSFKTNLTQTLCTTNNNSFFKIGLDNEIYIINPDLDFNLNDLKTSLIIHVDKQIYPSLPKTFNWFLELKPVNNSSYANVWKITLNIPKNNVAFSINMKNNNTYVNQFASITVANQVIPYHIQLRFQQLIKYLFAFEISDLLFNHFSAEAVTSITENIKQNQSKTEHLRDTYYRTRGPMRGFVPATQNYSHLTVHRTVSTEVNDPIYNLENSATKAKTSEASSVIISAVAIPNPNNTDNNLGPVTLQVGRKIVNYRALKAQVVFSDDPLISVRATRCKSNRVPINVKNGQLNNLNNSALQEKKL